MSGDARFKSWLLLLVLAGAAVYFFWYAFKAWRENRLVGDTPTSRVRSAAQGYVEFLGRGVMVQKGQTHAPLTGLPCTWWQYKIYDTKSNRRGAATIDSGTSEAPFILDDGTGQCLVDPRGAQVFPKAKTVWYGSTQWPEVRIPDGQGFFGKLVDALIPNGRYRYTEYRLEPHETVCALGAYRSLGSHCVESPDGAAAQLLHDWKQDQKALLARFDRNHDGVLDADEWDQARAAAHQQVVDHMAAQPPQPPGLNVLSKPEDGRAFLLSASDGGYLARRLRRNAIAGIAACVGSSAALVWMARHV
jgi:E3 ubiquitin ligase